MKKIFLSMFGLLAGIFVLLQFVPVTRDNPPVRADLAAPLEVKAVLKRSCYDCHSHETVWPWYSYVAPVSWMVARDVKEARQHLNFSTWDKYSSAKRMEIVKDHIHEEISEGGMPLPAYLKMRPAARLSQEDLKVLSVWLGKTLKIEQGEH